MTDPLTGTLHDRKIVLAAVKLFELGRLSSGRAAELAGMERVEFLLTLDRFKVCPFEAELNDLEATLGLKPTKPQSSKKPHSS